MWSCARLLAVGTVGLLSLVGSAIAEPVVEVQLRPVDALSGADTVATLPSTMAGDVSIGGSFYLEVWVQDVGSPLWGITGGYLDIAYDTNLMDATSLGHGGLYTNLVTGTINDGAGLVDEFGGSWLPAQAGDPPPGQGEWARLGWMSFTRIADGLATFTPQQADDEFSRSTGGAPSWSDIDAPPVTVPEPGTMTVLALGAIALLRRRKA